MRAGGALTSVLILAFASLLFQVSTAGDLYWEGEEDASNEFLEVKEEDTGLASHIHRIKRGFFDFWAPDSSSSTTTESSQRFTEDQVDEELPDGKDDDDGSGMEKERDPEPREKTLRVTFVVIQPYRTEYSNRDSMQFQTFSRSLADTVNLLFDTLPGTQRASLVRIQSRLSDEFSCKVTLDIVTTGYDDTDRITEMLHDHIRGKRTLGSVAVSDTDFSATVIDPAYNSSIDVCAADELQCNDGRCVSGSARCNGYQDCLDGSDEAGCRTEDEWSIRNGHETTTPTESEGSDNSAWTTAAILPPPEPTSWLPWDSPQRGDQNEANTENNVEIDFPTTPKYEPTPRAESDTSGKRRCGGAGEKLCGDRYVSCRVCPDDELRCDETRCVPLVQRCDTVADCDDGTDELGCDTEACGADDFRCNNGKCIEGNRRCDRTIDCPSQEDEQNCVCTEDEFRCVSDGSCIELRKRCDGVNHCLDTSDELNCACSSDQWQCDHGNCIKRTKRCDGRVDCPTDRSDERNCVANGYFRCRTGKIIPGSQRCNRAYDCPPGDYSDEQNCPCGDDDFRCDNGYCIPETKHCDRTHDCQDGSDEQHCTYGTVCMAYQYKCSSGQCVQADSLCNGTVECADGSDEQNCPCKRDEFPCRNGSCINIAFRCDGRKDCRPQGEDEFNCGAPRCPADSFTCDAQSTILCAKRCDGRVECDGGEDEDNCEECNHVCDNKCLEDHLICNGIPDCSDGSDEICDDCDGPNDFRCRSGECLNSVQRCNSVPECKDVSDEINCNETMIPVQHDCLVNQFQCRDGACIDNQFFCDGQSDCIDNSDEENCPCDEENWQCVSGQCIPASAYCDGTPDCTDNSDEVDCPTARPWVTTAYPQPYEPPTTARPVYTTTSFPYRPNPPFPGGGGQDGCNRNQWRCENGPCIDSNRRCDGHVDCPYDSSDEFDCPPGSPVALDLKTYPDTQLVRNGGDVVFQCRDEGPQRVPVRWVREGGRPLKPGSSDRNGRLEMNKVTTSDSGTYICQAVRYLGTPGSELRVELVVESPAVEQRPQFPGCQAFQATCGNGQCISKSAVCDGRIDCSDGSDEDACNQNGMCEPNQYQCANRKCVLKTWLCDSEDDCGDGSDEQSCGASDPRELCLPVEFKCATGSQCVPKSFHCDGQSDCFDGSDEIGCAPVHVTKPPVPSNVRLNPGESLALVCEAVGVPTPLISWRLNWGHVPAKCTSTSVDGVGTLTCHNMQSEDSGAYSCEAINNKGTTFAAPDSIVYVNRTDVCPNGYFNSEARSESECIRCFCFGESTQCRSADLFTYTMPTPLGEGGTRLVGIKQNYNGEVQLDPQPITEQYYYQSLRNGATVTKLANYGSSWSYNSNAHPYLTLPETYNANQLTSYGGHLRYRLSPHSANRYGGEDNLPDIIIKGKYESLIHRHRAGNARENYIEARLTPENWQKSSPSGVVQATREDIMMALDNIEMILLRADMNNAGVNITDFAMESAQHINVGLGAANLVEECTCPPGYEGLSCQKCASGYVRQNSGPWLGNCVREQRQCPPGTYGDPDSGYGCRPCPCPLTNPENQFARTCSIGPSGNVICDCAPGYGGSNCEYCESGYIGNPIIPGDSCKPQPQSNCNPLGTSRSPMPDECQCKDNVQGRYCDQCKNDSFYLSEDFRHGCALCFCSGVSQQCMSSNLRRRTNTVRFNTPQIVDQVKVYNSAPLGPSGAVKYNTPVETDLRPQLIRGEIGLSQVDRMQPTIYYWSLPVGFAGDKVTSYGGYLQYTLRHIPTDQNSRNAAADIQLISDNRLTFHYFGNFAPSNDGFLNASVQFLEKGWQRADGKEISREHFLLALADVKAVLIKATYTTSPQVASIESASIDTAEPNGNGPPALHVEQCTCPTGYVGTSCEDCAPGYTRSSSGLYLEHCSLCNCNGHSNMCHPETGVCYDCKDNTAGENCELCQPGYMKNAYQMCVSTDESTPNPSRCLCDSRGSIGPCDEAGYCQCKQNVEGEYCDRCRQGTFSLESSNPQGCLPCYCSGITNDCHEASHYTRSPMAAMIFGDNYGGYSLTTLNAEQVINDQFVPAPNESELMYIFSFQPDADLFWSLPVFPGNRVLSYGGTLSVTQKFESGGYPEVSTPGTDVILVGDTVSVFWSNPTPIRSGEALSYQVPLREGSWFILNTATPANRNDVMAALKNLRRVLVKATLSQNIVSTAIADVSMETAADSFLPDSPVAKGVEVCMCPEGYSGTSCENCAKGYYKDFSYCVPCNCNGHNCYSRGPGDVVCDCRPPYVGPDCTTTGEDQYSNVTSRPPPPPEPTVLVIITSPTIKIQEVGSSVNFTCRAESRMTQHDLPVTWTKDGGYLPQGRSQVDTNTGLLLITNVQSSDSGKYICQTSDGITTAQAIATLRVPRNRMTLPSVTIQPAINDYYEGERIQLQCIATGNPAPRISWQRASQRPLPLSAESYDESFIIENAREEDSGEYRCIASNAAGSTDRTAIVTVRPKPSWPTREKLTISPIAPTVNEGQSTRVVCTGTNYVPAGSISWIRQDGSQFAANVRTENGVLFIDYARLEDQGVFICQTTSSDVAPVPVLVTVVPLGPPPPSQTPNISVSVDHVKIPTGGSGTVDCNPQGYPLPLIRWKKYDGDFGPQTSQRENTLIIGNAQDDDQGYYLCEGVVDGTSVANIYVYVEIEKREPPRVEIWPQGEQAVALGSQFELHCRVVGGVPEPDVTWGRNGGRPLSTYTQIQPHNVLRFERIEVNDEGEYTCSATNVAGTASASAVIKVRSTPEIIVTPSGYIQAVRGDAVNVECRASGYPEPMVSIRTSPELREVVPQSPGIAALRIPSVSDRDEGDYVCTATSPAGTIDEQFVIRVDRGDGGMFEEGSGESEMRPEYYPGNNNEPSSLIAFEGEDRMIECNASDEFSVQWRRTDRPLQPNAVQRGATLMIYNASKSDSGSYECTVINRYTNEVQQAAYTSLQVVAAPRITLRPKTQTVHPGQSPTVECVVDGDDIIDINWRPVNRPLSARVESRQSTLIFHQIEVEDAGQYECLARNRYANVSAVAEVIVSEESDRETSESHDNEQYAHAGAAVQLSCNVTQPNLRIRWTKNGVNVPRSVRQKTDGSLFIRLAQKSDSGRYICLIQDEYGRQTSNYINLHIEGPRDEALSLVSIEQPRRQFRVGENVEVLCRASSRGTRVSWVRFGSNQQQQYVETRTYGDGSLLVVPGVEESDAGVYRCTGHDPYGRSTYEDFNLEVQPAPVNPAYPGNDQDVVYTARLGAQVALPCHHNLEQPVLIEWRREFSPLSPEVRANEPILHIDPVTEGDAGTYVCRISNGRAAIEARAILRVEGVVPRFEGKSWLSLSTLKDAYRQFDIEISFKPIDDNGLILYNSQNQGRAGDYLALHLINGVPQFVLDTGTGPVIVDGDRPLQLNTWHTIRLSRTNSKVTMDVDNTGPFITESSGQWEILDLNQPLYIGGVPDYNQLPSQLSGTTGFVGCVSLLILGREEKNIMVDSIEKYNIQECDSCAPNLCLNKGVCQEARNERGYMCLCAAGFAGLNCDRTGEACRPGLCGPGKCTDTADGYKCACPVAYTGRNCDVKQSIEYPAFTGSAYLAIKAPQASRFFKLSMKIKATAPVTDGIIMYCAESARGYGAFTSLAVHDGKLKYRYDLGDGSAPVVLTANRTLPANEWTDVRIARIGAVVSLRINTIYSFEEKLESPKREYNSHYFWDTEEKVNIDNSYGGGISVPIEFNDLHLETPMFVGGVDDSIVLNNNTGVTGGFSGCIKDVMVYGENVDIVNSSIQSANVQECSNSDRGDIPEMDSLCSQCRNGGYCLSADSSSCTCPPGYTGVYCESRAPLAPARAQGDPCAALPCRNGGTCRPDRATRMNYTCDCPLGYAGANCQMPLELLQSVGFNGNGYLELPAQLLQYNNLEVEPVVIALAFHTTNDGVLLYQREALASANYGDYILLRVEQGRLVLDWDLGSGLSTLTIDDVFVSDGERHEIITKLHGDSSVSLTVDRDHFKTGTSTGLTNNMNADSNVYIGGIPERFNYQRYPGLNGCIEQVELMDSNRGLNLGQVAVAGRNTQRCRESRSY